MFWLKKNEDIIMKIGNIAKEEQKICSIKQGGQVSLIEKGVSQVDI